MRSKMALLALVIATLSACALAGSGEIPANVAVVRVANDLDPRTSATVYLVDETGTRRLLGNLAPGTTGTFRYPEPVAGRYTLVARTTAGAEIESEAVEVVAGEMVRWALQANAVERGDG